MSPILELSGVSKSFGHPHERNTILRDVNLTVTEGDFVSGQQGREGNFA